MDQNVTPAVNSRYIRNEIDCVSLLRSVFSACGKKLNVVKVAAIYPIKSAFMKNQELIYYPIVTIK